MTKSRWMLGGEPPEPQNVKPPKAPEVDDLRNGDTHTGTDPLGRAIGPAESHLHVKRVRDSDGKIVTPKPGKGQTIGKAEGRARRIAEATGTKPEAHDNPTPILPAEVARLHGDDSTPDATED
jgi:hypothetical protein